MEQIIEIETLDLFPKLDSMLIDLLKGLTEEEWQAQTIAKLWKVKDVASHLLDGTVRALSSSRDGYMGETSAEINSYQDLVNYLNELNRSWVDATKRLSPVILTSMLELFGKQYYDHLRTLDPFAPAIYSVAWAGQSTSPNWFHIAREYTERFLHQQQIREAVNKPGLMTRELFYPFIDTLMRALPHTFADVEADMGTVCSIIVTSDIGGRWNVQKGAKKWLLDKQDNIEAAATVSLSPDIAWKLFSKSWSPVQVFEKVDISGDQALGMRALHMVSVMA